MKLNSPDRDDGGVRSDPPDGPDHCLAPAEAEERYGYAIPRETKCPPRRLLEKREGEVEIGERPPPGWKH